MPPRRRPDPKLQALQQQGTLNPKPETVRDPLFSDGEFFDPRDLLQVKYEMLRSVQTGGRAVTDAAEHFGLSRPTFYKTQSDFDRGGLAGLLPVKRGPRGPHKLTEEVMEFIEQQLTADQDLDTLALVERVDRRFGRRVHRRTIERALARREKKLR
jgi:transposase